MLRVLYWLLSIVSLLVLLWLGVNLLAPLVVNGYFYRVTQPVPVVAVTKSLVTLEFERIALQHMAGTCANEMQCTNLTYELPGEPDCPLERGYNKFPFGLPIPEGARGPCVARGSVVYTPRPLWIPLVLIWESEPFEVPE